MSTEKKKDLEKLKNQEIDADKVKGGNFGVLLERYGINPDGDSSSSSTPGPIGNTTGSNTGPRPPAAYVTGTAGNGRRPRR